MMDRVNTPLSDNDAGFLMCLLQGCMNSERGRLRYFSSKNLGADDKDASNEATTARLTLAYAKSLYAKLSELGYKAKYTLEDETTRRQAGA